MENLNELEQRKTVLEKLILENQKELRGLKKDIFFTKYPTYAEGDVVEVDLGGKMKIVTGELEYDDKESFLKITPYKKGTDEKSARSFRLYNNGGEIIKLVRRSNT